MPEAKKPRRKSAAQQIVETTLGETEAHAAHATLMSGKTSRVDRSGAPVIEGHRVFGNPPSRHLYSTHPVMVHFEARQWDGRFKSTWMIPEEFVWTSLAMLVVPGSHTHGGIRQAMCVSFWPVPGNEAMITDEAMAGLEGTPDYLHNSLDARLHFETSRLYPTQKEEDHAEPDLTPHPTG